MPQFDAARAAVVGMNAQFIEFVDPIERTLVEVYAALALDTVEFNSFETHEARWQRHSQRLDAVA